MKTTIVNRYLYKYIRTSFFHAGLLLIIFLAALNSHRSQAQGCDLCIQDKVITATTDIEQALQQLISAMEQNVSATETVNTTIDDSSAALDTLMDAQLEVLLAAIDAYAKKQELADTQLNVTLEKSTDHLANVITQAFKNYAKSKQLIDNDRLLGPRSQPQSIDIAVNRAEALSAAIDAYNARYSEEMEKFNQWLLLGEDPTINTFSAGAGAQQTFESVKDAVSLLSENVLTEEEVDKLLTYTKIITQPAPDDLSQLNPVDRMQIERSLEQKRVAYAVTLDAILQRAPLLSTDQWAIHYIELTTVDEGKTSLHEFMKAETIAKLFSVDWHNEVRQMTDVGLLREQVTQMSVQNYILAELVKKTEKRVIAEVVE